LYHLPRKRLLYLDILPKVQIAVALSRNKVQNLKEKSCPRLKVEKTDLNFLFFFEGTSFVQADFVYILLSDLFVKAPWK
jgi:hypothetical protein